MQKRQGQMTLPFPIQNNPVPLPELPETQLHRPPPLHLSGVRRGSADLNGFQD
jgi:hypothetical protein